MFVLLRGQNYRHSIKHVRQRAGWLHTISRVACQVKVNSKKFWLLSGDFDQFQK